MKPAEITRRRERRMGDTGSNDEICAQQALRTTHRLPENLAARSETRQQRKQGSRQYKEAKAARGANRCRERSRGGIGKAASSKGNSA
jgi:hypothetical protein